jgi:hypothetical protein
MVRRNSYTGLVLTSASYYLERTTMANVAVHFDKAFESQEFSELVEAPVDALAGISAADAEALKKALNIVTIRDLAENKFVRVAQAVVALAAASKK